MTNQSRRQFLKTGALFGAASAAAAVSAPAFSTEAPQKWDETTGLLIVGTGFAGCAAALEAHYLGAKKEEIMLVDKMSTPGGNSIINGGAVAAAGTDMQEKEGIKDSADLLFADIMKAGGGLCHPALARRIADESVANFKWLRDDIGVQFKAVTYHGGHSVKRSHAVTNNSGSGFILPMLAKLKEFGIEPRLRFIVDEIIVNDKKEVIGVKARQGYRFGRENSGKLPLRARHEGRADRRRRLRSERQVPHEPGPAPHGQVHLHEPSGRHGRNDHAGPGNRRQHRPDGLDPARSPGLAR